MDIAEIDKRILHANQVLLRSQNNPHEALRLIKRIINEVPLDRLPITTNLAATLIDIGNELKDEKTIRKGVSIVEDLHTNVLSTKQEIPRNFKQQIKRVLALGYFSIVSLRNNEQNAAEKNVFSEEFQRAKNFYSELVKERDFDYSDHNGYGATLKASGRFYESLLHYDKALELNPTAWIPKANKGELLVESSGFSTSFFTKRFKDGYSLLKDAIEEAESTKKKVDSRLSHFKQKLAMIEKDPRFNKIQNQECDCDSNEDFNIQHSDSLESYKDFCLERRLFLNTYIHNTNKESMVDSAHIGFTIPKDCIENINSIPHIASASRWIDLIKSDYITARYLLYLSSISDKDDELIIRKDLLSESSKHLDMDIRTGLLRTAYCRCYDLLDKTAGFINDYLSLGQKKNTIHYVNIFFTDRSQKILNSKLVRVNNPYLYALIDVAKDFNNKEHFFFRKRTIRNYLTHQKLMIYQDDFNKDRYSEDDKYFIPHEEFFSETVELMQIVKAVFFYTVAMVTVNEMNILGEKNIPIFYREYIRKLAKELAEKKGSPN